MCRHAYLQFLMLSAKTWAYILQAIIEEKDNQIEKQEARIAELEDMLSQMAMLHKQQSKVINKQEQKLHKSQQIHVFLQEMCKHDPMQTPW